MCKTPKSAFIDAEYCREPEPFFNAVLVAWASFGFSVIPRSLKRYQSNVNLRLPQTVIPPLKKDTLILKLEVAPPP